MKNSNRRNHFSILYYRIILFSCSSSIFLKYHRIFSLFSLVDDLTLTTQQTTHRIFYFSWSSLIDDRSYLMEKN